MNSTFTKEDEGAEVVIPLNGQSHEQQQDEFQDAVEPAEASMVLNSGPETMCGCTRAEVIVMKHTIKQYNATIKRLLHSDEFEVRRCANGQIVSQGRCTGPTAAGGIPSEEYQKAIKERDQARADAETLHANYASLFASFNNVREVANDLRGEYEDAAEKLKLAAAEVDEWQTKFLAVKENANAELNRASVEYDDLVRSHDENTKGLRLRVKRLEIELGSKKDENNVLSTRVAELSAICDQLLNDVDVCDSVSGISMDA